MQKVNTIQMTEWFMDLLVKNPLGAYDVLSAQRGPDECCEGGRYGLCATKNQVVARLRGIVWDLGEDGTDFPGNYTQSPCSQPPDLMGDSTHSSHYYHHLTFAVHATHHHPVWGGYAEDILIQLEDLQLGKENATKETEGQ